VICNIISFYGEEMLASGPTPKLEDHHMSAVNIFAATLHIWRLDLTTCHAVVTGTHLNLSTPCKFIVELYVVCLKSSVNGTRKQTKKEMQTN
jgi:hypothetical protein